jgi:hypothetical protein
VDISFPNFPPACYASGASNSTPDSRPVLNFNSLRKENLGGTTRPSIHIYMDQTFTFKAQSLYGAYAPNVGVCFYGSCFEEAVNGLTDELRIRAAAALAQAEKGERSASGRD